MERSAPEPDGAVLWRASIADITDDGPFSAFPGLDRQLLLCSDTGLLLTVDGVDHRLGPLEIARFAGEARTSACREGGDAVAFNVMTRRGRVEAQLAVRSAGEEALLQRVPDGEEWLLVALGDRTIAGPDGVRLARWDAVHCPPGSTPGVTGPGEVAVVRFRAPSWPVRGPEAEGVQRPPC